MRFGTPMTLRDFAHEPTISDDSASVDTKTLLTTLSATSQSTAFDITLSDDQVEFLNSTSTSSYIHYYSGPVLTTSGIQLQDTDDDSLVTISGSLTKIPPLATDADGEFTLTFNTSRLIDGDTETANENLQAARSSADDAADAANRALNARPFVADAANTALEAITNSDDVNDAGVSDMLDAVSLNATKAEGTDRTKSDFRTPEAVFAEVKGIIDGAIVTETDHIRTGHLHLRSRRKPRNLQGTAGGDRFRFRRVRGNDRVPGAEPAHSRR